MRRTLPWHHANCQENVIRPGMTVGKKPGRRSRWSSPAGKTHAEQSHCIFPRSNERSKQSGWSSLAEKMHSKQSKCIFPPGNECSKQSGWSSLAEKMRFKQSKCIFPPRQRALEAKRMRFPRERRALQADRMRFRHGPKQLPKCLAPFPRSSLAFAERTRAAARVHRRLRHCGGADGGGTPAAPFGAGALEAFIGMARGSAYTVHSRWFLDATLSGSTTT